MTKPSAGRMVVYKRSQHLVVSVACSYWWDWVERSALWICGGILVSR